MKIENLEVGFCFFPVGNHLIEGKMLHALALIAGALLHMGEALAEFLVGLLQGIVGVHADVDAISRQSEEQVAVFRLYIFLVVRLLYHF